MNIINNSLRYDAGDFAYGTWRILDQKIPATIEDLAQRLHTCLEQGITTLDTAEIYGGYLIEKAVGKVLKSHHELREGLKVVTKAGIDVPSAEKPPYLNTMRQEKTWFTVQKNRCDYSASMPSIFSSYIDPTG
jgi:predicted oxidoreductase